MRLFSGSLAELRKIGCLRGRYSQAPSWHLSAQVRPFLSSNFYRQSVSTLTWRALRIAGEAVVGVAATICIFFLISLLYYAPPALLTKTANDAKGRATRVQKQADTANCGAQLKAKDTLISGLRDQLASSQRAFENEKKSYFEEAQHVGRHSISDIANGRVISEPIPSNDPTLPLGLKVVIQFGKRLTAPLTAAILCDQVIGRGEATLRGPGFMVGGQGIGTNPHVYILKVSNPDIELEDTVVFKVFSTFPIHMLRAEVD